MTSSDYSIGVKVTLSYDKHEINNQIKKIQDAINAHNLEVKINISDVAMKGLEKLAQGAKIETAKIKKGFEDIVIPLNKMKDIKILTQDWQKDENGINKLVRSVGVLRTTAGNTIQITQELVQQFDSLGNKTEKTMMQSTQKIVKLNKEMTEKLKADLISYKTAFQTSLTNLNSGKGAGFISKEDIARLNDLSVRMKQLKPNEDLFIKFRQINLELKDIKVNADSALKKFNDNSSVNKLQNDLSKFRDIFKADTLRLLSGDSGKFIDKNTLSDINKMKDSLRDMKPSKEMYLELNKISVKLKEIKLNAESAFKESSVGQKLTKQLVDYTSTFKREIQKLENGKTVKFIDKNSLEQLKRNLNSLEINKELPSKIDIIKSKLKDITQEAKIAFNTFNNIQKVQKKDDLTTKTLQDAKLAQEKIRSGWKDTLTPLEKLDPKLISRVFIEGENGAKTLSRIVGYLHTETGKVVQITQQLVHEYDKAGNIISSKMMESTRKVEVTNHDMMKKLSQDLENYQYKFANIDVAKLKGGNSAGFIDNVKLTELQNKLDHLSISEKLPNELKKISQQFTAIKIQADLAFKASEAIKNNNNKSTPKIDLNSNIDQLRKFETQLKEIENEWKLIDRNARTTKNSVGEVSISVRQANNEIKEYKYVWDSVTQTMRAGVETTRQNKIIEAELLAVKKESLRIQLETKMAKPSYAPQIAEMRTLLASINALTPSTSQAEIRLREMGNTLRRMDLQAQQENLRLMNERTQTFGEAIGRAAAKMLIWVGVGSVIFGAIQQIKDAMEFIKEMDTTFTQLQMEMTGTVLNFKDLTKQANEFAIKMGSSTKNVAEAVKIFGNYNSTLNETMSRSKAAVLMSNLTNDSIKNSADGILAVQLQFKMAAESAEHIVDVFAGVARNLQIDYGDAIKEISGGIARVGSLADQTGLKFEKLASMIGTSAEVTRMSGDVVGNAYKTIISRMTNVGDEADPEAFKKIEKSFYEIGVSIKSSATTIKPMGEIFDELAVKWKDLNDVERNQIATDAAGIRQKNIFIATMDNYNKILDNTKSAEDSAGLAMQKQDIYMTSLAAKLNQLKETVNKFYLTLSSSDTLKGLVVMTTGAMGAFTKLAEVIGGLPAVFGLAVFAISAFSTHAKINQARITSLMISFSSIIPPIGRFAIALKGSGIDLSTVTGKMFFLTASINTLKGAFISVGVSLKSFALGLRNISWASLIAGISGARTGFIGLTNAILNTKIAMAALQMVGIMMITVVIGKLFEWFGKLANSAENAKKAFKDLSIEIGSLKGNIIEADNLLVQLQSLQEKQNNHSLNTEDSQKLLEIQSKLAEILPNTATGYTVEGKAISENSQMVKEQIELNKELIKVKQNELLISFRSKGKDELENYQKNNKELNNQIKLREKALADSLNSDPMSEWARKNLSFLPGISGVDDYSKEINKLYPLLDESKKALTDWAVAIDESGNGAKLGAVNINALMSVLKDSEDIDMEKLIPDLKNSTFIDELKNANEELNKMRDSGANQNDLTARYDELAERLQHLLQYEGKMSSQDGQSFLNKVFIVPSIKTATQDLKDLTDSTLEFNKAMKDQTNELGELNQLIYDNVNGVKIQGDKIMDLILKYPDLTDAMTVQNGVISFSTQGLEILRQKRIEEMKIAIDSQITTTNAVANSVGARLKSYGIEIDALTTLEEAQGKLAEGRKQLAESNDAGAGEAVLTQYDKDSARMESLIKSKATMEALMNQVFTNPSFGVNTSKADSNASKAENAAEKEAQAWETLTDEINKYVDAVTVAQQKRKEDFDATGAKLHSGYLAGADATNAKIQAEESYVNDLFGAYNDLQKSILDWRVKQDKFKVGTREYDEIEKLIQNINDLKDKSVKLAEAEVPVLAKMKKEWNDMYKPIVTMKSSFDAIESKIKSVSETFKNSIREISTKVNFNTIMNTDSSGTGKELFESLLDTYKNRITDFYSLMDDLRRVDTQKTDQFVALTKKKNEGTLNESEEAILNEISNWDELNDKLIEYGLTVEEIIKIQKDYAEISKIVTKQEKQRENAKKDIEAEKNKLEKMNDQLTVEKQITDLRDKQLKLAQAQDDLEKEKLNRNNEIILASGERTLTYDVSKVQELYKAKEIAQKDVNDTLRQQDLESQKEAISDEIKAKQDYLDNKLPILQDKEMAQYVKKWNTMTNKQFLQEQTIGSIQTAGANSRIETMKLEIKAVRELWDLRIKNASEAGKAEREAYASGLTGTVYTPANYSNPNITGSVKIVNNIVSVDGINLTSDQSKGFIDYLNDLGLIENSN